MRAKCIERPPKANPIMKLKQIPGKVAKRISAYGFGLFGIDSITRAKITPRRDLQEFGTSYGGWVIPTSIFNSNSVCYCVGCGEDITFDLGMIEHFQCDIHGFDPTPRAIKHVTRVAGNNPKYHLHEVGLWDKEDTLQFFVPKNPEHVSHSLLNLQKTEDCISVKVKRLSRLMEELGHQRLDLLKIDIEGAEYKVIETIVEDRLDIKVICVEFDECYHALDRNYKNRIQASVNSLLENGYSMACAQGDGNYTFVKNGN
ncbi:MAG: hypothetical protein C0483_10105 [Pirellula sp.]|nr:hypothetical protein [Pirellula sp.]